MAIRNPARPLGIEPRNAEAVPMDEPFGMAGEPGGAATLAARA